MQSRRIEFGSSQTEDDAIYCRDAVAVARAQGAGTLDLIYIDPPFGTGRTQRNADKSYEDLPNEPDAFVDWLFPCLAACRDALRPTGSLFVHLDYRAVHYVKVALDSLFGRSRFVNELVWCYSVGGKSRRTFGRKHDTILWYSRTSDYAFYPDAVSIPRKGGSHMRVVYDEDGEPVQEKTDRKTGKVYRYPVHRGKLPEDWWTDIETLNRSDGERVGWPTQKPRRLLERVIQAASTEGDRVADWFSGSGTTAVVAQALRRSFVASDRLPEAVEIATQRLLEQGQRMARDGHPPPDVMVVGPEPDGNGEKSRRPG